MNSPKRFGKHIVQAIRDAKILGIRAGNKPHRIIGIWAVVVEGRVFVRSYSLKERSWYRTFLEEPRGVIEVDGKKIKVRPVFTRSERLKKLVDRAYAEKFPTPGSRVFVEGFKEKKRRDTTTELVPLALIAVILLAAQVAFAQSGRRKSPPPAPTPSPVTQITTPTSSSTTSAKPSSTPALPRPAFHPKAFIITGKTITEGAKSYGSDDFRDVADAIKFMFELQRMPAKILKGSKMTREQAVFLAKQQTDSYVLWMQVNERFVVVGLRVITILDHIDYFLLMPGTGEVVRQFEVDPGSITDTNEHGTPVPPRTRGTSTDLNMELRRCGWEIARVLNYWL